MQDITKSDWNDVVTNGGLVIVDFWATWCAPCKTMLPIFDRLVSEVPGLTVVKVNADENPDLVSEFGITSIPTMLLYKNGEHVWTHTGAKPLGRLLELVAPYV